MELLPSSWAKVAFKVLTAAWAVGVVTIITLSSVARADVLNVAHADNNCTIRLSGELTMFDADEVVVFLTNHTCRQIDIELFNSVGGSVSVYDVMNQHLLHTPSQLRNIYAQGYCFSTCALIYVGLPEAKRSKIEGNCNALIGFHKTYFVGDNANDVTPYALGNQEIIFRLKDRDVPEAIIKAFINTNPNDLESFTARALSAQFPTLYDCTDAWEPISFEDYEIAVENMGNDFREFPELIEAISATDIFQACSGEPMLQIETVRRTLGKTTYVTPMLLTNMGDEALDRDKECWRTTIQDFFDALTIENIWDYVPNVWFGQSDLFPLYVLASNGVDTIRVPIYFAWNREKLRTVFVFDVSTVLD